MEAKKRLLTYAGLKALEDELENLKVVKRKEVAGKIKEAREPVSYTHLKNEPLHGKTYLDGGVVNNVPLGSLVKRGYENVIEVRIYGPGREPKVRMPQSGEKYVIAPRVKLGSIIEFSEKRSRQNLKIGYFDAKRMLYLSLIHI